jgi:APA family basic amino acid/polyamine antiporter
MSFLTSSVATIFGHYRLEWYFAGAGVVFFAGFDAVSLPRSEKSTKGMPIGILGSLVICTVLYVLFAY